MPVSLNKDKILDAARAAFAKHGFRKTALADIARPLGVAKTAVYHYFPGGKRELFDAVIQREEDAILAEMRRAVLETSDPRDRLRMLILAKLAHVQGLRELLDVSMDVGEEIAKIYYAHETAFHERELEMLRQILASGREEGIFCCPDAALASRTIRKVLRYMEFPLVFEKDRENMERDVDALLDILFYGIVDPALSIRKGGAC